MIDFYLASTNPFYARTGWKLDFLLRDAEQLYIDVRRVSGAAASAPLPSEAKVRMLCQEGRAAELQVYPVGEPVAIARQAAKDYATLLATKRAHSIAVQIGAEQRTFRLEELA